VAADFDDMMKQLGVKPMKKGSGQPRKKARSPAVKPSAATKKAQAASVPQIDRSEALSRTLAVAKEERAAAEAKVTSLKKKVRRLKAEKVVLEEELARPRPSVAETLADWGFQTPQERSSFLAMDGWLERIISHPSLSEDVGLRTEIEESLVRVCDQCSPPRNKVRFGVSPDRCTICGGVDMAGVARAFVDAALLHGRLRIVIVGRSTEEHRAVRRLIGGDKRLVLTQLPGDIRRDPASAQTDVDHADVVVAWDEESIAGELLSIYRGSDRYGAVPAGPVGVFLEQAAPIIARD